MKTIYLTKFNPDSANHDITAGSTPCGFDSLVAVEFAKGTPMHSGKRTRTYHGEFYSDYPLTVPKKIEVSFL